MDASLQEPLETDVADEGASAPAWEELSSGGALVPGELGEQLFESAPRLILLAGQPDAGKTTLLTSIYEEFQRGGFKSLRFAGSNTLLAFEERCFYNRAESGLEKPDTQRTLRASELRLLHLRCAPASDVNRHIDLLMTDLSGELFADIRDSASVLGVIPMLDRVDHLVLLLDGEALLDAGDRTVADLDAKQVLERFIASDMSPLTTLHLVVSKKDLLEPADADGTAMSFGRALMADLEAMASGQFLTVHKQFVAARPTTASTSRGLGLERLVKRMMAPPRALS